jgi:tRNA dimethylallyltransferase
LIIDVKPSGKPKKSIVSKVQESSIERRNAPKILFIGGPTASGKSYLALQIARDTSGEIINADSRQIYRNLSIGTSQPDTDAVHEIPHHLYAFVEPSQEFTAADFEQKASEVISQIIARGNLPIVVGGTGFYMKALLRGVWPVGPRNEELRKRLRTIHDRHGAFFFHKMLMRLDPESAANIAPRDSYRMIRALEILFQNGIQRSQLQKIQEERYNAQKYFIDPGREKLHQNIEQRTNAMLAGGWIEEVKQLIAQYPGFENMPASKSLGYSEILQHLNGKLNFEQCKEIINLRTKQYAKRQRTWFRNQDHFEPLSSEEPLYKMIEFVLQWYRN